MYDIEQISDKVSQWEKDIEEAKSGKSEAIGQRKELLSRIKEKLDVDTIEGLENVSQKLKRKIKILDNQIEKKFNLLKEAIGEL